MASRTTALPQLDGGLFLTDGGIETTLIFHEGLELPHFAAYVLLDSAAGEAALRRYFRSYVDVARRHGTGLVLESPTWRLSADWGERLGHGPRALAALGRRAVALLHEVGAEATGMAGPVVVSGCVGPRGDGYVVEHAMAAGEAEAYHRPQIETFAAAGAHMIGAITMNYAAEATGVARAARAAGLPVAISFTVETDGRLPTGQTLAAAIAQVDDATDGWPAYYMVNCAHPTHVERGLASSAPARIRGLRANASRMSHAELNEATALDAGDPDELGREYAALLRLLPSLNVMGGCCGTDARHVDRIAAACAPLFAARG